MNVKIFLILPLVGLLFSCGEAVDEDLFNEENENVERFTLNAIYDGCQYSVPCLLNIKEDTIIFLDNNFKDLFYNEISKLPDLICEIKSDGTIEYKNGLIEEQKKYDVDKQNVVGTQGTTGDTYVQFFENVNYGGKSEKITLTNRYRNWQNGGLAGIEWGNNISSIKAYNRDNNITEHVYLLAYDQSNFSGHVLRYELFRSYVMIEDPSKVELPDLRNVPMQNGSNWNDKIQSMKFYW